MILSFLVRFLLIVQIFSLFITWDCFYYYFFYDINYSYSSISYLYNSNNEDKFSANFSTILGGHIQLTLPINLIDIHDSKTIVEISSTSKKLKWKILDKKLLILLPPFSKTKFNLSYNQDVSKIGEYGSFEFRVGNLCEQMAGDQISAEQKQSLAAAIPTVLGSQPAEALSAKSLGEAKGFLVEAITAKYPDATDRLVAFLDELTSYMGESYPLETQKSREYLFVPFFVNTKESSARLILAVLASIWVWSFLGLGTTTIYYLGEQIGSFERLSILTSKLNNLSLDSKVIILREFFKSENSKISPVMIFFFHIFRSSLILYSSFLYTDIKTYYNRWIAEYGKEGDQGLNYFNRYLDFPLIQSIATLLIVSVVLKSIVALLLFITFNGTFIFALIQREKLFFVNIPNSYTFRVVSGKTQYYDIKSHFTGLLRLTFLENSFWIVLILLTKFIIKYLICLNLYNDF